MKRIVLTIFKVIVIVLGVSLLITGIGSLNQKPESTGSLQEGINSISSSSDTASTAGAITGSIMLCIIALALIILPSISIFRSIRPNNKKGRSSEKIEPSDLEACIEHWSEAIMKAPTIVWSVDDIAEKSDSWTRAKKELYVAGGLVYIAEHMISQNVAKNKARQFGEKLLDSVAKKYTSQMLEAQATRSQRSEYESIVKKAYYDFTDIKSASDNTPAGTIDYVVRMIIGLDPTMDKATLTTKLGDFLKNQRFADFANIASHILKKA